MMKERAVGGGGGGGGRARYRRGLTRRERLLINTLSGLNFLAAGVNLFLWLAHGGGMNLVSCLLSTSVGLWVTMKKGECDESR